MLKYVIRLDDACPTMNKEKWDRMEELLSKYNIKPIVGVIPENRDSEFNYNLISNFWEAYVFRWQQKGWLIAQHGLHHNLNKNIRTEFKNKSYEEQLHILKSGYQKLIDNNIKPNCFFAPAHTFDNTTIKACKELKYFEFISDGYSFYPYEKNGMMFLPSVFDTPHKISKFGVFTFVYHPNKMKESDFEYLENFIKNNNELFDVNVLDIVKKYNGRKRNILDYMLLLAITSYRNIRDNIKGDKDD